MPEVKQLVVQAATQKLFSHKWFDICQLKDIAELVGAPKSGRAWTVLAPLHCVHYEQMPPMLREAIPHLVNECLAVQQTLVIDVQTALKGVDL